MQRIQCGCAQPRYTRVNAVDGGVVLRPKRFPIVTPDGLKLFGTRRHCSRYHFGQVMDNDDVRPPCARIAVVAITVIVREKHYSLEFSELRQNFKRSRAYVAI